MKRMLGWVLGICVVQGAWAEGKDHLWELTTTMEIPGMPEEMKGMKIPGMGGAQKQTVCLAEGKQETPEQQGQTDCKVTDRKSSGKISRMTIVCKEGTMKMEHNQISRDHYIQKSETVVKERGSEEAMKMTTEGKRIGSCDAAKDGGMSRESKKLLDESHEQAAERAAAMGKACQAAVGQWPEGAHNINSYVDYAKHRNDALARAGKSKNGAKMMEGQYPDAPGCAKAKLDFCAKSKGLAGEMGTRKGYMGALKSRDQGHVQMAFSTCGIDISAVKAKHCKAAVAESDYGFVAAHCPAERAALGKQHCAGRAYTAVEPKYQVLCGGGESSEESPGHTGEAGPQGEKSPKSSGGMKGATDAGAEVMEQGMKKLKGLLGF